MMDAKQTMQRFQTGMGLKTNMFCCFFCWGQKQIIQKTCFVLLREKRNISTNAFFERTNLENKHWGKNKKNICWGNYQIIQKTLFPKPTFKTCRTLLTCARRAVGIALGCSMLGGENNVKNTLSAPTIFLHQLFHPTWMVFIGFGFSSPRNKLKRGPGHFFRSLPFLFLLFFSMSFVSLSLSLVW